MGYQRRASGPRNSGRGRGIPRHEKAKAKKQKQRLGIGYVPEEDHAATSGEVVERTLSSLRNLGKQVFAVSPFSEHFGRWLVDVKVVLSEFESSLEVGLDDPFLKERSRILSDVELQLDGRRRGEASAEKAAKSLADNRVVLERIEEGYLVETKAREERKAGEVKRLSSNVHGLREEVDRIGQMKTGILRGLSKKAKARKEAEAKQRLSQAEKEFSLAMQDFAAQQERLKAEYEKRKQPIVDQMGAEQKEVDGGDIDHSLEARQAACEALVNAVNSLVQRKGSSGQSGLEH
jgi:hypothetical protein